MFLFDWLVSAAQTMTGFFNAAGQTFIAWGTSMIPLALVALTVLNTIVALIGEDRFDRFAQKMSHSVLARYTLLPYMANFVVGSPASFVFGRYLPEKYKAGFFEVCNKTNEIAMMCFFPHVNPGEMFMWLGVYTGVVTKYGANAGAKFAAATFLISLLVSPFIGLLIEKISFYIAKRKGVDWDALEVRKAGSYND